MFSVCVFCSPRLFVLIGGLYELQEAFKRNPPPAPAEKKKPNHQLYPGEDDGAGNKLSRKATNTLPKATLLKLWQVRLPLTRTVMFAEFCIATWFADAYYRRSLPTRKRKRPRPTVPTSRGCSQSCF